MLRNEQVEVNSEYQVVQMNLGVVFATRFASLHGRTTALIAH